MKYTILGFNQLEVVKLNLDMTDIAILRWFIDFRDTGKIKAKEINGDIYYWVKYEAISEDLPILNLKKDTVYRRFKKICEAKVLKHKTVKEGGTWSFFAIDENYEKLISSVTKIIESSHKEEGEISEANELEIESNGHISEENGQEQEGNGCTPDSNEQNIGTNNTSTKLINYKKYNSSSADAEDVFDFNKGNCIRSPNGRYICILDEM